VVDGNEIVPHMKIVKLKAIGSSRTTYECALVEGGATGKPHFCVKVEQLTGYTATLEETQCFWECLMWIKLSQPSWYDKILKEWPQLRGGFEMERTGKGKRTVPIGRRRALADSTLLSPARNLFFGLYCGTDGVAVCLVEDAALHVGFGHIADTALHLGVDSTSRSAVGNMLHAWNKLDRREKIEFRARLYFMTYVWGLRGMCEDFGMRNVYNRLVPQQPQHVLCAVNYGKSSENMFDLQAIAAHLAQPGRTESLAYEIFATVHGWPRPDPKKDAWEEIPPDIRAELLRTRHLQRDLLLELEDGRTPK